MLAPLLLPAVIVAIDVSVRVHPLDSQEWRGATFAEARLQPLLPELDRHVAAYHGPPVILASTAAKRAASSLIYFAPSVARARQLR